MPRHERRTLKPHPKLLMDVIMRQAGTLSKAILEAVMNSVDAGAKECRILLTKQSVRIEDNGRGFRSADEIHDWFEVFGQPHDERENKIYGTFRMGRGQLFAYGENIWRSGNHEMTVDVKENGLDYDLWEIDEPVEGCEITVRLYDHLSEVAEIETVNAMRNWVKYAPIRVWLNDELLSVDVEEENWDFVDDDAYIRMNQSSTLHVYNQGIHVLDYPAWRCGCGGVVVSRKRLTVNFARNDIIESCPVWRAIRKHLSAKSVSAAVKRKKLYEGERRRLITVWLTREIEIGEIADLNLLEAVTGRNYKFADVSSYSYPPKITAAPRGSRVGDSLHRQNLAFVFSQESLEWFGVGAVDDLLRIVRERDPSLWRGVTAVELDSLKTLVNDTYLLLPVNRLSRRVQIWYTALRRCMHLLADRGQRNRDLRVGVGPADGWTDSETFIAVHRDFLDKLTFDAEGVTKAGALLLHEFQHRTPSNRDHDHDQTFYEDFHDRTDRLGRFTRQCTTSLLSLLKTQRAKDAKRAAKDVDKLGELESYESAA